jgi:hypothetical protein
MNTRVVGVVVLALAVSSIPPPVGAQGLGTFRWQLRPFCNLVTLSVQQDGDVYTLDGSDDQCGGTTRGSVTGTAFLNPDGTIGFGLSGATAPGAAPLMLYARLNPATVSGTWSDSAGNSGAFVFTPGAGTGGAPRPVPPNGIRPGSVTAAQIAPGAVGAAQISPGSITAAQIALGSITGAQIATASIAGTHLMDGTITAAKLAPGTVQVPIVGACPIAQYLRGVTATGAVICEPMFVPTLSTTADNPSHAVGAWSSIAIGADGLPVISHQDVTAGALRVTKCGNPGCTAGNVSTIADDPVHEVGRFSSIAIGADGLPVISHMNVTAHWLRVTKCGNADCTAGNVSVNVDGNNDSVGIYSSIAIGADGLPIISHQDFTAGALRVTRCGTAACSAGNVSTTVDDPATSVGWFTSLAIGADGLPIISHGDASGLLRMTKCGNPACTADNVSTTADPLNGVGYYSSVAIGADGLPVISHQDRSGTSGNRALRVTKCGNHSCTAGTVSTTVDDPANEVGYLTSLAIGADGLPVISHLDATAGALRVTKCGNPACRTGNVSTTVDDGPDYALGTLTSTSIAIGADALPVISHQDTAAASLRVTKCGTQSCR